MLTCGDQVCYTVTIVMNYEPLAAFFSERWSERCVARPSCEHEARKLARRANMYSEERWCGRRGEQGDWVVRRRWPGV